MDSIVIALSSEYDLKFVLELLKMTKMKYIKDSA